MRSRGLFDSVNHIYSEDEIFIQVPTFDTLIMLLVIVYFVDSLH